VRAASGACPRVVGLIAPGFDRFLVALSPSVRTEVKITA
jgi:hypothetical protein